MIKKTCHINKTNLLFQVDLSDESVEPDIYKYLKDLSVDFNSMCSRPGSLRKLCIIQIKQKMQDTNLDDFLQLGLPQAVRSMVMLEDVVQQLFGTWE